MTPVEVVVHADVERRLLLEEQAELHSHEAQGSGDVDVARLSTIIERLDLIDSDSVSTRATQLLENLGFSEELRARPMSALSGGWRVRTALAAAIFARPDMLLLDEPTNHLSIGAVLWLIRELSANPVWDDRILVIVSHDRYFLDAVSTDVLHVSGVARRLTQQHGNYTAWSGRRAEQQKAFARQAELRRTEIKELREYAGHGFKYGGSSASINKMAMKAKQADKLELVEVEQADEGAALQEDVELALNLQSGGRLDGFLIQLLEVSFGYPGATKPLFAGAELGIDSSSRLVLLGENGAPAMRSVPLRLPASRTRARARTHAHTRTHMDARSLALLAASLSLRAGNGKTTLVKLMIGALEPTAGEVRRKAGTRIAIVNQHHADQLDLDKTPLEFMADRFPGDGSNAHMLTLRSHLDRMGVPTIKQSVPAYGLSGGQRSRVALAAVSYVSPHVLVLDEPTNNLDLESVGALAECVQRFEGAVILVSHDQFFVSQVANEVWVVAGGKVKRVESFEKYRAQQLRKLPAAAT
jgi:ATP-binding cassette subfamily F protein 3